LLTEFEPAYTSNSAWHAVTYKLYQFDKTAKRLFTTTRYVGFTKAATSKYKSSFIYHKCFFLLLSLQTKFTMHRIRLNFDHPQNMDTHTHYLLCHKRMFINSSARGGISLEIEKENFCWGATVEKNKKEDRGRGLCELASSWRNPVGAASGELFHSASWQHQPQNRISCLTFQQPALLTTISSNDNAAIQQ
jgi:hypothetical protein